MSTEQPGRTGDDRSLEQIREASDAVQKSTLEIVVEKVTERWMFVMAILVVALTSYLLFRIDGEITMDVWIFGLLSLGLVVYFLATLRTDIRME